MDTEAKHAPAARALATGALRLLKEAARLLLRRPVLGVALAARAPDGRWLLVRRADTGSWGLPGGTLEWGETLRECIARELEEETGAKSCAIVRLVGVFSRPDRDPRFHGVTVLVECRIDGAPAGPQNPAEIREARLFAPEELPRALALGMTDMLEAAMRPGGPILE